jgi:hypothetical protein
MATPSSFILDGPFLGNGNFGAVVGAEGGLSFYLGANNLWSSNTAPDHGLCDAAANTVNPLHSGNVYTLIGGGVVALFEAGAARGEQGSFTAVLDFEHGSLSANYSFGSAMLRTESFIAANDDVLLVNLTADAPLQLVIEVSVPASATRVATATDHVLPTTAGVAPDGTIFAGREGVNTVANNVLLNTCGRGGQHDGAQSFGIGSDGAVQTRDGRCLVLGGPPRGKDCADNATQRIVLGDCGASPRLMLDRTSGNLVFEGTGLAAVVAVPTTPPIPPPTPFPAPDGYTAVAGDVGGQGAAGTPLCNCSSVAACPDEAAKQCNADPQCRSFAVYSPGGKRGWNGWCQMYNAADTGKAYPDSGWNLYRKGKQPLLDPFVPVDFIVAAANATPLVWTFEPVIGFLSVAPTGQTPGTPCLTFVEPNRNLNAAVAVKVVGEPGLAPASDGRRLANTTVSLQPGRPLTLVVANAVCCKECTAIGTPQCGADQGGDANLAVSRAQGIASAAAPQATSLQAETVEWWDAYWNASAVNLGPRFRVLEQFYFGMLYTVGAAGRPGKMAPGLWGPWITTDSAGWNGDYTLNYNFQASYYGVFATNHPELAETFFPIIEQMVPLGEWRTKSDWAPRVGKTSIPGAFTNFFGGWPDVDGGRATPRGTSNASAKGTAVRGINFPGHFGPFPEIYYPNDMGQRSDAVFCGSHFWRYFDSTQNKTFLEKRAYPYLRKVADFYESFIVLNQTTGRYDVRNSCGMENCNSQNLPGGVASNNSPFDLGLAITLFRKLAAYSVVLGVDADRRERWVQLGAGESGGAGSLATFPRTVDPSTGATVLSQQQDPNGFPTLAHYWNARYPITYFAGMFCALLCYNRCSH